MSKFYPAPPFHFPAVQNVQYTLPVELEDRLSGQVMTDSLDLHVDEDGDLNFRMENEVQL